MSPGRLPLYFETNQGQTDAQVAFLARGAGSLVFLKGDEAVLKFSRPGPGSDPWGRKLAAHPAGATRRSEIIRMRFVGAGAGREARALEPLPGRVNYLLGNRPDRWVTGVPTFGRVQFDSIYPGVDVTYYGKERALEYDLIVAPGTDPAVVQLEFSGAEKPRIEADGSLALATATAEVRLEKPLLYQRSDGVVEPVRGAYRLLADGRVGFAIGSYDRSRSLVIDPIVSYSGTLGGAGLDSGTGAALDAAGNAYVTGYTESTTFPVAAALRATPGGSGDAFVAKLSPDGARLVYATYLGGGAQDAGADVEVDATGAAYIAGATASADFPRVTPAQPAFGGDVDAFAAKLNPAGNALAYSTTIGGSARDGANGIAVNAGGGAVIAGFTGSANFPATGGALQTVFAGDFDAFVTRLNAAGNGAVFSTLLGGSDGDIARAIALAPDGTACVVGGTDSSDFPVTANAVLPIFRGGRFGDGFVSGVRADGAVLAFSTFCGGSGSDAASGVAVDATGNIYVGGTTESDDMLIADPAITPFQTARVDSSTDCFLIKYLPDLSNIVFDTLLGGSGREALKAIGVDDDLDPETKVYVFGETDSPDFPTLDPLQVRRAGGADFFLTKLHPSTVLVNPKLLLDYSTYLGGVSTERAGGMAVRPTGDLVVVGDSVSNDFPQHRLLPGALRRRGGRGVEVAVVRVLDGEPIPGGELMMRPVLDMGKVGVGRTQVVNFLIKNNSRTANLAIRIIPPRAPFGVTGGLLSVLLAPGQTFALPVSATPGQGGRIEPPGQLVIESSDPNRPRVTVPIIVRGRTTGS